MPLPDSVDVDAGRRVCLGAVAELRVARRKVKLAALDALRDALQHAVYGISSNAERFAIKRARKRGVAAG